MEKKWFEKSGREGDVVISSRIRLARNLQDTPFPIRMNVQRCRQVRERVVQAAKQSSNPVLRNLIYLDMEQVEQVQAVSMVESHLISPDFISKPQGRGLLLSKDHAVVIMINEEDHLRIQVMREGMQLQEAYRLADELDTALNDSLHFAFDPALGYLTQCPTNLGTGMRASLMLHLPALQHNGMLPRLATHLSKVGLTLRGTYGEGTEPVGALYQLSNQVTLGLSETAAIENLERMVMQLVQEERQTRTAMMQSLQMQDVVARAMGILQHAKILSTEELMRLLSQVRLGVASGMIQSVSYDTLNRLMINTQPATMMTARGHELSAQERDQLRAEMVAQALQQTTV